jgi:hypothetical protein
MEPKTDLKVDYGLLFSVLHEIKTSYEYKIIKENRLQEKLGFTILHDIKLRFYHKTISDIEFEIKPMKECIFKEIFITILRKKGFKVDRFSGLDCIIVNDEFPICFYFKYKKDNLNSSEAIIEIKSKIDKLKKIETSFTLKEGFLIYENRNSNDKKYFEIHNVV